ncbi:MAG: hypothetical protein Kow0077_14310 [Anaerolineae bacterium]
MIPQARPVDYARAFALNAVFFVISIGAYGLVVSANPVQIAVLVGLSVWVLVQRVRLIRVEAVVAHYPDEALFLQALDELLCLRDRWELVEERLDYRRYEGRVFVGLYRFTAALEVWPQVDHARLRGHYRILRGVLYHLNRPHIATFKSAR